MAQNVQLPDGTLFPMRQGETPEQALMAAAALYPDAFAPKRTPEAAPQSGGIAALKAGFSGLKSDIATLAGRTGIMDPEAAERYIAEQKAYQARTFKPTETFAEAPFTKFRELLGGSAAYMAAPLAAGVAAATLPVAAPTATVLGLTAAGSASFAQFTGSFLSRQMDTGKKLGETELGTAALAALPAAALDTVSMRMIPGIRNLLGAAGRKVTDAQAKEIAQQGLGRTFGDYVATTGKVAGVEGLTESAQQFLERLQAGLSTTDKEARDEYLESFLGGAVLGGTLSVPGRFVERGRIKSQAEEAGRAAAQRTAEAEEAARSTPEALNQLYENYQTLSQQKTDFDNRLKTEAPRKGSTDAEKQAFQDLKAQRTEFLNTQFKPVEQEYNKRRGAIEQMMAQRQMELETAAAPGQAAATRALPSDIPGAQPFQLAPVPRLMGTYGDLRRQLDALETELSAGPDIARQRLLEQQRAQLNAQITELGTAIEQQGGTTDTLEELNKKLKTSEAERLKLLGQGDFDAAKKLADKIEELQLKLPMVQEAQLLRTQAGQTRELFGAEPEQPEAQGLKYVSPEGKPISVVAEKPEEAAAVPAGTIPQSRLQAVDAAKAQADQAEQALTQAARTRNVPTEVLYKTIDDLNQAENALSRAKEDVGRPTLKPAVLDIFSPANIMQEALRRGDTKVLNDLARQTQRQTLQQSLDEKATERDRLITALEGRLDAPGVKRERADLFSEIYDQEAKTKFKNGTYPDKTLQALYDEGGAAAVEYEWVLNKTKPLMAKVTTPQGNAKKSLYEQLVETAAEHSRLVDQMESGVATPTMREKTAQLQAKLGKGEAPAARQMDAGERAQLKRKIASLEKKFRLIEGKVAPIRDQILEVHNSLYKVTPLEKPSVEKEKRRAEAEAEGRAPKRMSRAAATAKRIAAGDVRREAEASEKMRDLALELGKQEPGYKSMLRAKKKQLDALIADVGADSPKVRDFRIQTRLKLDAKAADLGRQTPEYKATLKEQTAVVREALAQSKQEVPTKRTPQVTRRQTAAPKELRVAGSRMTPKEIEAAVKEANNFDGGTAYRLRESDAASTVDAAEAQKVIDGLKLPENVKFVYAPTAGKIPVKLLQKMAAEGVDPTEGMVQGAVFSDGTVLVVGDQHADITDLEKTIAHEIIGHYGVDTVIGIKRLNKFAQDTDVIALAEQIGGKDLVREVLQTVRANADLGRSEEIQKLQALREIIAHAEEARVTESFREKAGRFIKELVGMIRAGLRDMGFTSLPRLSTSDVFYMLKQSRKAFANKTIGPYKAADGQIAFRLRREQTSSVVGREPGIVDKFLGNLLGLSGRVQYVDQYAALSAAIKKGMDAGLINSLEATNAEYLLRFGQQRSQFAGQFLLNGPVRLRLTKKGGVTESLFESTKGVSMVDVAEALNAAKLAESSVQEDMFTVYMAGERAKQVGWEKLNFENPAEARAEYESIVAQLNANKEAKAAFENAAKLYKQYNAGLIDFLEQTGVLNAKRAAELKATTYVPYYRVNNNGEVQLMIDKETPVRISNIKDEPQLQQLVGGNEYIMPIFTSAAQNTFMITNLGLRNQTVKETGFLLQKLGIASRLSSGAGPKGDNVVRFKKNGEDYHVVIDTDLYGIPAELIVRGMEGIKTTLPAIVRMMGYPADILRKFVTRMPAYAVRQIIRDPLNAWLTTGTDAVPVLSSMKELASMVAGRSDAERKLMSTGAISSNVFSGDEQDISKFLQDMSAGKSMWAKTLAKLDAFALQGDAATRAVIYKDSLDKGMSEQEALLRTLESMNFSRRGLSPSMQSLSVLIPFFNAQIQGLDVVYRAFKGDMPYSEQLKIKEKLMARGALLALGTIAYAAMMEDDEAYKRAKPQERYSSWFVYVPGVSEPFRVPIPFELGFLFKALPEAVYNVAFGDDKASKALSGLGALLNQTQPLALPQAIKPLTEVVLGKSFYSGDIESMREKQQLATDRYRENTTEVAKLLGKVTGEAGVSPISIDYLIRGYFGGLGIAIVQLANPILAPDQKNLAEPSTKPSKLPLIGGLFQPVEGRGTLDEAYSRMLEVRQVKGTYNKLIEEGKRAEALEFAQNYSNDLAQASVSGRVQKQLGELAKQERFIKAHPTMTTEEKDQRLAQIDKIKIQIARQYLGLPR